MDQTRAVPAPVPVTSDAEVIVVERTYVAGLRASVPVTEVRDWTRQALPVVAATLRDAGVRPSGPPMSELRPRSDGALQVTVGYPVSRPPVGLALTHAVLPAGIAVRAVHIGPHESIQSTYDRLVEWLTGHHRPAGPALWEQYIIGPDVARTVAACKTAILCPQDGQPAEAR